MIFITAVRMRRGGTKAKHITDVRWLDSDKGTAGTNAVYVAVSYLGASSDRKVQVAGPTGPVEVRVVQRRKRGPYLRTADENRKAEALLSLPRF